VQSFEPARQLILIVSPQGTMDPYDRFHDLLKRDFAPLLRGDGFKGSGTTFRRISGEVIHVVNIQGSKYGGQCCVGVKVGNRKPENLQITAFPPRLAWILSATRVLSGGDMI
jgi:hypothetical protein